MIVVPTPFALGAMSRVEEPIHMPGSIQPYGILMVLATDLSIMHVSANIEALLGVPVSRVLGRSVATVLGVTQGDEFAAAMRRGDLTAFNPTRFVLDAAGAAVEFECTVHRSRSTLIVEFEPTASASERSQVDLYAHVRTPIARMEEARDVETLTRVAAAELQAIGGFERAMICRFDENWNGEVVAEAKTSAVRVSYFGWRFPASELSEHARRLYSKNALEFIPDVDYVAAPLVPERDPVTGLAVDLSRALLRSAPSHRIDYLQSMGVRARLTISIVIGGRLWGIVVCHNSAPLRLDYEKRAVCELLGQMLAWQLSARFDNDALEEELAASTFLATHDAGSGSARGLAETLVAGSRGLLDTFKAQGLAIRLEDTLWRVGATPQDDGVVGQIAERLCAESADGIAASNFVGELFPLGAVATATASGALLMELSDDGADYVLCFREELVETVHWGAEPQKSLAEQAGTLRPRLSFAHYRETMRGRSSPWSSRELATASGLRHRLLERRKTSEGDRNRERIRYLAQHDLLTQLPNRASLHDALRRCVEEAERDQSTLAVLVVDVDRLKLFNDAFGNATGDLILQAAAERMRTCVDHRDIVARLGGDEFAIVLPDIASDFAADDVAARILAAVAEPFFVPDSPELSFTVSIGIAFFPKDAREGETLLRHADHALYRAKEQGRNTVERFGGSDDYPTYERFAFARQLQQGLLRSEFVPYYQPIVSARDGRLVAMEALARWNHPTRGMLPPSAFIALADESRSIVSLGEVMLRAACSACVGWRATAGGEALGVSVNVSARQFRDSGFLHTIREAIAESGLSPDALQLELTESMLIGDEQYAIEMLRVLANDGISVAIDDFGTGYSSLSYLKRLPVGVLKIDRSFISDLMEQPGDTAIVRAIIAMAHSLRLDVVAEGVETVEQLHFLRDEGCDTLQGFLIAKPLAYPAASAFIEEFEAKSFVF